MKSLVLTEKPSVAREIARVLNCSVKNKGYLEGPRYVVTWALGHLVTLAEPEDYDQKYKQWRLIGINLTRALTCRFNAQLTAGRVQTPTLAIIVQREEEIKKFVPVDYWAIRADFGDYFGDWRGKEGSRIFDCPGWKNSYAN